MLLSPPNIYGSIGNGNQHNLGQHCTFESVDTVLLTAFMLSSTFLCISNSIQLLLKNGRLHQAITWISVDESPVRFYGIPHDDVIKWRHFPRYWPFVRGIHRSPVNSPHKGQWRGALMFTLICARINGWVNNREADDSRRHRTHYDVT